MGGWTGSGKDGQSWDGWVEAKEFIGRLASKLIFWNADVDMSPYNFTTTGTVNILNSGTSGALKIGAVGNQLKISKAVNGLFRIDSGTFYFQNLAAAGTILGITPIAGQDGALYIDGVSMFEFEQGYTHAKGIPGGGWDYYYFEDAPNTKTPSVRVYGYPTGLSKQYGNFKMVDLGGANAFEISSDSGVISFADENLTTTGRIATGTTLFSTEGPTDNVDVSGINTLFIDAASSAITIGGFAGGVNGQVLHIVKCCATANAVTLEHNEGGGSQDIFLHAGADEALSGEYGGWILVCNGTSWFDASHSKHV